MSFIEMVLSMLLFCITWNECLISPSRRSRSLLWFFFVFLSFPYLFRVDWLSWPSWFHLVLLFLFNIPFHRFPLLRGELLIVIFGFFPAKKKLYAILEVASNCGSKSRRILMSDCALSHSSIHYRVIRIFFRLPVLRINLWLENRHLAFNLKLNKGIQNSIFYIHIHEGLPKIHAVLVKMQSSSI